MTIDGIDITTLGFRLVKLENRHDLPARKTVLSVAGTSAAEIVFRGRKITAVVRGKFATTAALVAASKGVETLLKSQLKHLVDVTERNILFIAVAADGFSARTWMREKLAEITITFHLIEDELVS